MDIDTTADLAYAVLFARAVRIIRSRPNYCVWHSRTPSNLMRPFALKDLSMDRRTVVVILKTIRKAPFLSDKSLLGRGFPLSLQQG